MMDYSSSNSYISEFEFDNSEYSERPYKRLRFERYKVEADVHSVLTRRNKITGTRTWFGRWGTYCSDFGPCVTLVARSVSK